MILRPFKIQDYVQARIVNDVGLEFWGLVSGVFLVLRYMERSGTFWTLLDGDEIVVIAGWHQAWAGVCEVSLFPTERFVKNPLCAIRLMRKTLRQLSKEFRRVQLNCRYDKKFLLFALRLGFRQEGILKRFAPDGSDHVIMSLREDLCQK
jgi:hypothetical protein